MIYDFDTVTDRTGTSCLKYDFAVERGKPADILPLWVADMDFPTAPAIRERLAEVAAYGIYGYSDGKEDYFAAINSWYTKHFGWSVQRDWVIYTPGVVFALSAAVRAFTAPGDSVLIQQPVYYPFTEVITDNDRVVVNSSLVSVNGRYQMDLDDFEKKIIDNHVRLFLLCSPHNPVGRVWAKEAYVLDLDGETGRAAYKAPSLISFAVEITGKSAHAGFCPEQGIHAIQVAAEIIAGLQQGYIGDDTTFNIGMIEGGVLTNIVPEKTVFRGEIRSYDHQKALDLCEQTEKKAQQIAEKYGANSAFTKEIHLKAYETDKTSSCVQNFQQAAHTLGLSGELTQTFGGSDNNPFAEHGIKGLVLSNGMYNPHSVNEYTTIHELLRGMALVQQLIFH